MKGEKHGEFQEESEKDTTKSDFSEIEVEIQPPSESTHSEEEEQVSEADMLLGVNNE